jgi:hypothetical protein
MTNLTSFSHGILATKLHIILDTDWKLSYFAPNQDEGHDVQFVSVFLENIANAGIGHDYNSLDVNGGLQWTFGIGGIDFPTVYWQIAPPPTDAATWVHVTIDVLFDPGGNGHAYLKLNNQDVVHMDNIVSGGPTLTGQHTISGVVMAWANNGTTPELQATYDNIVMRVE